MPKMKTRLVLVSIVALYVFLSCLIIEVLFTNKPPKEFLANKRPAVNLSQVIVHLDLKGAPPTLGYLTSLLAKLKANGATGLLLEYEDMFPYEGVLANLSARNCYGKKELFRFLRSARSLGLELIPLVQTFGHLESALKLQEFQNLREVPEYPDSLCPSVAGSRDLVSCMLEQVLNFHKRAHVLRFVHIGCDEVFHINSCASCRNRMLQDEDIFLQQVLLTSAEIKGNYPNVTILIWDDMLRGISPLLMEKYDLGKYVEPVVWDYKPRIDISHTTVFKYYKTFDNLWIASAFKGAGKKASTLPDITYRFRNHLSWMNFIRDYRMAGTKDVFSFRGIFITGWSRFSHFDVLCEMLPLSIPSLILSLLTVKEFVTKDRIIGSTEDSVRIEKNIVNVYSDELNCTERIMNITVFPNRCHFNENAMYTTAVELDNLVDMIVSEERKICFENGDLLDLYLSNSHMNPNDIIKIINKFEVFKNKLIIISEKLENQMKVYYDSFVISEYVNFKLQHCLNIVVNVLNKVSTIQTVKTWDRGPLMLKYL